MRTRKVEEEEEEKTRIKAHLSPPVQLLSDSRYPGGKIRSIKLLVPNVCHSFSSKNDGINQLLLRTGTLPDVRTNLASSSSVPGGSGSDFWTNRKILRRSQMYL